MAPDVVTRTLEELASAAAAIGAHWSLVGGQALIAHGVPRDTLDADALVAEGRVGDLAMELVRGHGWVPLKYDAEAGGYVECGEPAAHYMEDPVLFDVGTERVMYPLRSTSGLLVELLSAQHPLEEAMIEETTLRRLFGATVPVAPLGGVLLVKVKADRIKDIAAVEQMAEHLDARAIEEAIAWAREHDPETASDLESIVRHARVRRAPTRIEPYRPGKK